MELELGNEMKLELGNEMKLELGNGIVTRLSLNPVSGTGLLLHS
jgi:hypothetical protein